MTIQVNLNILQLNKLQRYIDNFNNAKNLYDKMFYLGLVYGYTEFTDYTPDYSGKKLILKKILLKTGEACKC